MRGFRGSRSVVNQLTARFGRKDRHHESTEAKGHAPHAVDAYGSPSQHRPELPEWLQTPEYRERKRQEALANSQASQSKAPVVKLAPAAKPLRRTAVTSSRATPTARASAPKPRKATGRAASTAKRKPAARRKAA